MNNSGQTTEEAHAERAAMDAEMDAAEGIEPAKGEAGEGTEDKTDKTGATKTDGEEAGKSAEPTDGAKSGEEVDPNVVKSKAGTEPGIQKKIDKLTAKNAASENEAAYWKRRAEEAEAAKGKPNQEATPDEQKADDEPVAKKELNPDDFETIEEYEDALLENKVDERLAIKEKKAIEENAKKDQATKAEDAAKRTYEQGLKAKEKYEDFDDVVKGDNPNLNVLPPETAQMVLDSDVGADLAYQIGKDPELAARLADMTPSQAIREIVKLEAPFVEAGTAKTDDTDPGKEASGEDPPGEPQIEQKRVSGAPAPVGSLGNGSGVGKPDALSDDADISAWMKKRDETATPA